MFYTNKTTLGCAALAASVILGLAACSVPQSDKSDSVAVVEPSSTELLAKKSPDQLFSDSLQALSSTDDVGIAEERFVELTRAAAERGQPDAINNMGAIYMHGMGDVKSDLDKSIEWYERLASIKDMSRATDGHRNAGYLYYQKFKQSNDRVMLQKAVEHFRAAAPEDAGALTLLSMVLVESGLDKEAGRATLRQLAANGSVSAKEFLARAQ